ncbi:hypothetical protein BASA81_007967 [Batrachochytrium salamandrivorans]|nr:hypothetical protein BASA81_007967 [Batrachochytrium salamandrivorans]
MESFLHAAPPLASILVYLVPFKTISDVSRSQTSGDLPSLTFVSMAVTSAIWGTYGGLKNDPTLIVPNFVGAVLSLYYLYVFEANTPKGSRLTELYTYYQASILLLGFLLFSLYWEDFENSRELVGTCGAVLSVVFSSSPLSALPAVIRTRSPESIPLPISLVMFANSVLWASYGYFLANDRSIWFPNLVGTFVSSLQLLVHIVFFAGLIPKKNLDGVKSASL